MMSGVKLEGHALEARESISKQGSYTYPEDEGYLSPAQEESIFQ